MLNISINRMKTSIVTDNKLFYLLQTILIVVTFIVFYPVLGHDFLYSWDDQWQVLNSYTFNGFSQDNLINILFNSYYGQYSPLNQFFYTCIYSLLGSKPVYFHAMNLLFHLGCVLLAFNLISSLLLLRRRDNKTKIYLIAFGGDTSRTGRSRFLDKRLKSSYLRFLLFVGIEFVCYLSEM